MTRELLDRESLLYLDLMHHANELRQEIETLKDALYRALPFVEDALEDPAYKRERVAEALAQVCKALNEPV